MYGLLQSYGAYSISDLKRPWYYIRKSQNLNDKSNIDIVVKNAKR